MFRIWTNQDLPGEILRKDRRLDSEKTASDPSWKAEYAVIDLSLTLGPLLEVMVRFYWLLKLPLRHSQVYKWLKVWTLRPDRSSRQHVIMPMSKREFTTPGAVMGALSLTPQWKAISHTHFSYHRPITVLSSSREFPFLIHSPKIHHTLWMSLGLLRSTIFT